MVVTPFLLCHRLPPLASGTQRVIGHNDNNMRRYDARACTSSSFAQTWAVARRGSLESGRYVYKGANNVPKKVRKKKEIIFKFVTSVANDLLR